jgi:hypothetical protein
MLEFYFFGKNDSKLKNVAQLKNHIQSKLAILLRVQPERT